MAGDQGTGKHPHKSAADPKEHHEAKSTKSESTGESHSKADTKSEAKSGSHTESSSDQGTGKHPHKKASDPKEHHEGAKK